MATPKLNRFYSQIYPYIKMLRLPHQFSTAVVILFAALDIHYLHFVNLSILIFGLTCLSIMMFLVNEYYDSLDTDKYSTRERVLTKVPVSPKVVGFLWFVFALLGALPLLYFHLYWQLALLLFVGTFYTAPPLRFKARFPWDILSLSPWVIISYSIPFTLSNLPISRILDIPFYTLFLVLLLSEMIHFITDIEPDSKAGLKNTATALSPNTLLRLAKLSLIGATMCLAMLIYRHSNWWYYPLILILPYIGYALGRLREVMYEPNRGIATLNTAYNRAMKIGNYLVLYEFLVFVFLLTTHL